MSHLLDCFWTQRHVLRNPKKFDMLIKIHIEEQIPKYMQTFIKKESKMRNLFC